jgi:hypothetical protein
MTFQPHRLNFASSLRSEIDPQPFRDAEHPLPVRDLFQDMGQQPFAVLDHSFLMARGAQEAALARVSHQKFMAALRTFKPLSVKLLYQMCKCEGRF